MRARGQQKEKAGGRVVHKTNAVGSDRLVHDTSLDVVDGRSGKSAHEPGKHGRNKVESSTLWQPSLVQDVMLEGVIAGELGTRQKNCTLSSWHCALP